EAKGPSRLLQYIENAAGLDARPPLLGIHLEHTMDILRPVDHHPDVAALASEARAAAARDQRRAVTLTHGDGFNGVVDAPRHDHADGNLAIVGSVGRIERTRAVVEPNFTANLRAQIGFEPANVDAEADRPALLGAPGDAIVANQHMR